MIAARREYVGTGWGQLHVRRAGDDGPTVVLLHESPLSSRVYEDVLERLGRHARGIAVDTPGYGMSDGPPGVAEIPDYAGAVLEGLDALGVELFAVVGVHTGASLAVQLAVQAPTRVTHAVLSGVPLFDAATREAYLRDWAPEVSVAADGSHLTWAWERYERIWEGPPELLHLGATTLLDNLTDYHRGYNAAFRYDPEPDLPRVACPVLLHTAERDLLVDADRRAVDLFPDARLDLVPDLVGQLPLRRPEAFADRILDFVS